MKVLSLNRLQTACSVRLDNEDLILGYVSGKIRRSFIRILPGDNVKIEVSRYDSTRGRIIYCLRNKDSKD
uniref:translational initiation factor 1 n=1 Tax=Callitriche hermaphroditica TaxID=38788 RepID=UPI00257CE477|nr:translational initiation factor 1 [Callitriche hermaphroditica]WHU54433.1 translational initiation factor 1 [Callitriche hermaphroditica]